MRAQCTLGCILSVRRYLHPAVRDVDPLDDQDLTLEFDLSTGVSHQTGGVDPPGRECAGECAGQSTGGGAELPPREPGGLPPLTVEPHGAQPGKGRTGEDERLPVRARVVTAHEGTVTIELAGVTHTFSHAAGPEGTWLGRDGDSWHVQDHDPVEASLTGGARSGVDTLAAPMPGTVTVVKVAVGDHVDAGQSLLVVEAMKMEHVISAPHAGTVTELDVTPGSTVAMDQVLAVVTPQEES